MVGMKNSNQEQEHAVAACPMYSTLQRPQYNEASRSGYLPLHEMYISEANGSSLFRQTERNVPVTE